MNNHDYFIKHLKATFNQNHRIQCIEINDQNSQKLLIMIHYIGLIRLRYCNNKITKFKYLQTKVKKFEYKPN